MAFCKGDMNMKSTLRRTWAEIDLDALAYNYHKIREHIGPKVKFLGVVKADAYGHGAVQVGKLLQSLGANYLAVSSIDEAMELRFNGITMPILILGHTPREQVDRLICFNIQSLGGQLKAVAMLYMLEFINTRVMTTERSSSTCATWVYFDEIYLLLQNELSAQFLFTSWKRFRKYNAFATGITQNIEDCLSNSTAYAMLANSEFVCMLRQTKDIDHVVELYGLSDIQRNYLLKARPGQGILKMGNALIPFVNDYPKNTKSYRLLTTTRAGKQIRRRFR